MTSAASMAKSVPLLLFVSCYLHARSTAGWRGQRAAGLAVLGVATFWSNFVGINLLVSGLHSYAGV